MDSITNEYYLGTFTRNQPELNWRNADLQKQVYSEIDFWLQMGVDGFRMDVANWYVKDDKFRSNPWSLKKGFLNFFQKHIYDRNRPETHQICKEIRKLTDKYPERMLVGEIFSRDISKSVDYYGNDDELHLDFLFQKWGAKNFRDSAIKFYNSLGEKGWPNFTLSNHDQPRHYYRYKKGNKTKDRAKVAAAMLLTLKGTPFIYYGEEIGMTNGKIRGKDIQDPLGKSISFLGRDGERTPMQWDSSLNSGFSKTKPWLPVNPDYIWKNTVVQQRDPNSLLNFYVKMINLRNSRNSLKHGDIYFIDNDAKDYMAYQRFIENEITLIIINFSGSKVKAKIDAESYKTIIFNNYERTHFDNFNNLELAPYEIIILEVS